MTSVLCPKCGTRHDATELCPSDEPQDTEDVVMWNGDGTVELDVDDATQPDPIGRLCAEGWSDGDGVPSIRPGMVVNTEMAKYEQAVRESQQKIHDKMTEHIRKSLGEQAREVMESMAEPAATAGVESGAEGGSNASIEGCDCDSADAREDAPTAAKEGSSVDKVPTLGDDVTVTVDGTEIAGYVTEVTCDRDPETGDSSLTVTASLDGGHLPSDRGSGPGAGGPQPLAFGSSGASSVDEGDTSDAPDDGRCEACEAAPWAVRMFDAKLDMRFYYCEDCGIEKEAMFPTMHRDGTR